MPTERVGVYRKYHGPVPMDATGNPLPKSEWANKRPCCWVARWFGTGGNRYSKSFETRKEAERFAETKQAEVRQGKGDPLKSCTIREFWKEHGVLAKGTVRHGTLHLQQTTMAMLAKQVGWDCDLRRVSSRDIEKFRADRLDGGVSKSTANKDVAQLKHLFNIAIQRGYVPQNGNPCATLKKIKVGKKRKPYCSPEQFHAILAKLVDPLWRALLVVYYTSGLRLNEAMNLTWSDIDFGTCLLHVTRRDEDGFVQEWSPKDHELRAIPLPEQAINLLTIWQAKATDGCPYIFMEVGRWEFYRQHVMDKKWKPGTDLSNNVLRRFQTLCKRAGMPKFTIQDLRRSCITNWARHLPIQVTQLLAGHSDIKTTQEYYLSVQDSDLKKAQRVQKKLLGEVPQADPTDPKLTLRAQKREFPKRKLFKPLTEVDEL